MLDSATAAALLLAAGWDTQPNGRVLCPVRGLTPELSADRSRVLLPLRTGTRAIIEAGQTLRLQRPPSVQFGEVTLVSFERADLRDPETLERAAALVQSVGARRGVLTTQGPSSVRHQMSVRVEGLTVIEERVRGPWVVRLEEDRPPKVRRSGTGGSFLSVAMMLSFPG